MPHSRHWYCDLGRNRSFYINCAVEILEAFRSLHQQEEPKQIFVLQPDSDPNRLGHDYYHIRLRAHSSLWSCLLVRSHQDAHDFRLDFNQCQLRKLYDHGAHSVPLFLSRFT